MKQGQLIAVHNRLYEYIKCDEALKIHIVSEVGIDWDGILTSTHILSYFYPKQLEEGFNKIDLTTRQWYGLVEHILRQDYELTEEEIAEATDDIFYRCFTITSKPTVEELTNYIAEYMDR